MTEPEAPSDANTEPQAQGDAPTDEQAAPDAPPITDASQTARSGAGEPPDAEAEPAPAEPSADDKRAAAAAEAARLRDQLLRTAADFDNFRKRTRRELEDRERMGRESIVKDLLPVFDNLERAATHAEAAADPKSVVDGLRIVLKHFQDTLGKMGIKRVPAVGSPFDPSVHEAIQHLASTEYPSGVVLAEVQPGYMFGDHLVRAAMVVVSKGPPEGEPEPS